MPRPIQLSLRPLALWSRLWAARSQQSACHNAMVASTLLDKRRAEREEVESYLAAFHARRRNATTSGQPRHRVTSATK